MSDTTTVTAIATPDRPERVALCIGGPYNGKTLTVTTHGVMAMDDDMRTYAYDLRQLVLFGRILWVLVTGAAAENADALARALLSPDALTAYDAAPPMQQTPRDFIEGR